MSRLMANEPFRYWIGFALGVGMTLAAVVVIVW
jgi:hypothetical protein